MCSAKIGMNLLAQKRRETDNSRTARISGGKNITMPMMISANKHKYQLLQGYSKRLHTMPEAACTGKNELLMTSFPKARNM